MHVGQKILTVSRPPYTACSSDKELKVVEITVTSVHDVEREYGDGKGVGYLGIGDDGHTYAHNYPIESASYNTEWHKHVDDDEVKNLSQDEIDFIANHYLAYDVSSFFVPKKAKFADQYGFSFCDTHHMHYADHCSYCKLERSQNKTMNTDKHLDESILDMTGWY